MSVISYDELVAYMGGTGNLTPDQVDLITDVIIPGVQEELEKYLNQTVELVQVRESLTPDCDGWLYFTYAPVRKIISATWSSVGSVPTTIVQYIPDPVVMDPMVGRPVIDRTGQSTTSSPYRYYVGIAGLPGLYQGVNQAYMVMDYIAGYDGTNDNALKTALLRVTGRETARQFDTSVGIRSGTLEQSGEDDNRPKGWTREELKAFDRLKRRVIV